MNREWKQVFRKRMADFADSHTAQGGDIPVSIKIRVTSGCFHREHSPIAYELIDEFVASIKDQRKEFAIEEHESGPEVLVYLSLTAAGVSLAAGIINLITAILKARSDGIHKGDRRSSPVKLIIRRTRRTGEVEEQEVTEIHCDAPIVRAEIESGLNAAAERLLKNAGVDPE